MHLGNRVRDALERSVAAVAPDAVVRRVHESQERGNVDVVCKVDAGDGRDWVAFQTVSYAREGVTPDRMRIHVNEGGRPEFVCYVEDAQGKGVPASVRDLALKVRAAVAGADVQALALSPRATALLDGLRDIVVARAREDEEALAAAMSQGRDLVLTYRPSLADMLPPLPADPAP